MDLHALCSCELIDPPSSLFKALPDLPSTACDYVQKQSGGPFIMQIGIYTLQNAKAPYDE